MTLTDDILREYDASLPNLRSCASQVEGLLRVLLRGSDVEIHEINGRVKERTSLERKIGAKADKYKQLGDITDVVGLRITCYLDSTTAKVVELVRREFHIDEANSVDKSGDLAPEQFGYRSIHLVARIGASRAGLNEYQSFNQVPIEIQVRSILQHAWAEIEHDLGYKSDIEIPRVIRRKFSRLAGLLELADEEFDDLRRRLDQYKLDVVKDIKSAPGHVLLDNASLAAFILGDPLISKLDQAIVAQFKLEGVVDTRDKGHWGASRYSNLGFGTISDLKKALEAVQGKIVPFMVAYVAEAQKKAKKYKLGPVIERGYALWWFCYFWAQKNDRLEEYLITSGLGMNKADKEFIAEKVRVAFGAV